MKMSESEIQASILQFLMFKNIKAWRNNNGSVYDPTRGIHRSKNKWEKTCGDPVDILGVLPNGLFLAIEVKKNEKEKATKGQIEFMNIIAQNGGVSFVAYSIGCVKKHLVDYLEI